MHEARSGSPGRAFVVPVVEAHGECACQDIRMGAVDDYLAGIEDPQDRRALARIYEIARELAPDAEQGIGYRMPALKHRGKVLISAIRAAKHLGVYPFSADAVAAVAGRVETIEGADSSAGAIRFAPGSEIPDDLIRDLVAFRLEEIDAR